MKGREVVGHVTGALYDSKVYIKRNYAQEDFCSTLENHKGLS